MLYVLQPSGVGFNIATYMSISCFSFIAAFYAKPRPASATAHTSEARGLGAPHVFVPMFISHELS
jgi:hypothetical protein